MRDGAELIDGRRRTDDLRRMADRSSLGDRPAAGGPRAGDPSVDRSAAFSWREFEPGTDSIPPAPGLPPVSTLKRPHPVRRRVPWLLAIGGLLYALTIALWVLYR